MPSTLNIISNYFYLQNSQSALCIMVLTSTVGCHAFPVMSLLTFKQQLKKHLFRRSYLLTVPPLCGPLSSHFCLLLRPC